METQMQNPSAPISLISSDYTRKGETRILMQCHDPIFKRTSVHSLTSGQPLFTVKSNPWMSWSFRRTLLSSSGEPLLHLRKVLVTGVRNKWVIDDAEGKRMCELRHVSFSQRSALDVVWVCGNEEDGKEFDDPDEYFDDDDDVGGDGKWDMREEHNRNAKQLVKESRGKGRAKSSNKALITPFLHVRPKDSSALTTFVSTASRGGAIVAEINLTEENIGATAVAARRDRSVWKAKVVGGMDLALVVAIMLCRAEMQHVWKN